MLYTTVTMKPVYPTATLNSLLSALDAATARGNPGNLDFRTSAEVVNVDDAPLGALNPAYNIVARLDELDPTCKMAAGRAVVEDRKPTANIGRTSLFREFDYRSAVSAQIGAWYRELLILYSAAREADSKIYGAGGERLSDFKDVETTDGPIEMFLMAIGDIDNSWIRYPIDAPLRVDDIMASIVSRFSRLLPTLDHYGFESGFKSGDGVYGIGTMPGVNGEKLAVLPARTFDRLGRSNWRIALRNIRVRERMQAAFLSRYAAAITEYNGNTTPEYIALSEGDDYLLLPHYPTAAEAWTAITGELDGMADLSLDVYGTNWHWTHQFYNTGELVNALFVDGMDSIPAIVGQAPLNVRVRALNAGSFLDGAAPGALAAQWPEGDVVDTGNLWSVNLMDHSPVISGSTDYIANTDRSPALDGYETSTLPTGILHIASCSDITALQMIRFMEWLMYAWSHTGTRLMEITGRARKQMPRESAINLSGTSTLFADANINSAVSGTRLPLTPSFNRARHELAAQQGPYVGALAAELQPIVIPNANNWGGLDVTSSIDLSLRGAKVNYANLPCIVSGQMSTGKAGHWQQAGIMTSRGAAEIVDDAFGLPTDEQGNPIHYGTEYSDLGVAEGPAVWSTSASLAGAGQAITYRFENTHPVIGQMKGFFAIGGANSDIGVSNPAPDMHIYSRTSIASAAQTIISAQGTSCVTSPVLYPNMSLTSGADGRTINTAMQDPRNLDYLQTFYNAAAVTDVTAIPHHHGWMWDPAYAQVVGNSWKRMNGVYDDGKPIRHPYFSGAISVFSPFVVLSEINGKDYVSEHSGQIYVTRSCDTDSSGNYATNGSLPANAAGDLLTPEMWENSFAPQGVNAVLVDIAIDDLQTTNSIENGAFHPSSVRPVNPPVAQPSYLGNAACRELLRAYYTGDNSSTTSGYTGNRILGHNTPAFESHFNAMNGWSHLFSLKSSMTQSPIMKLGAIGLGKTNASGVSGISGPVGIGTGSAFAPIVLDGSPAPALYPTVGQVPPLAHCWQGEKYELNLHVESNIAACITVDTPGLCKSGSRYRLNDDCDTWLFSLAEGSSYEGKSIPAFGPVRADCTGVDVNVIGGRHYGRTYDVHPDIWWGQAPASLDYTQIVNTAFSSASTLTHHPWFDDSMQIVELPAGAEYADGLAVLNNAAPPPHLIRQRRAGDTPSPWVAGETSAPRLVEVKYNSSDLGPAVDAIQAAVEREGEAFVKGLHSNEAFLKVQMYN